MKTLARTGAIVSFTFFLLPGIWLAFSDGHEGGVIVLGMILIGIAFFAGPMLWLTGEKCCSKQDGR
jgi:hypothetical protein